MFNKTFECAESMDGNLSPTLLVLAGGMGSRYGGLKQLDGVGPHGETIIDYSVFDAIRAGFQKVVFVVRESIADEFSSKISNRFLSLVDVELVYQPVEPEIPEVGIVARSKPWGTGHAVLCAKDAINSPFAVLNADDYYGVASFELMHDFLVSRVTPARYSMVGFELGKTLSEHGSVARAICEVDDAQCLQSIVERSKIVADGNNIIDQSESPSVNLSPSDLISMNFWGFHPGFFADLEEHFFKFVADNQNNPTAEYYIPTGVDALLKSNRVAVEVLPSSEQWHGLTYADDMPGIRQAMSKMSKDKLYPSPLWD